MLYDYRFQGHKATEDPRSVTTAAGGCTWCTYPAYRYLLVSDNAFGVYGMLKTTGLLIQQFGDITLHDLAPWVGPIPPIPGVSVIVFKEKIAAPLGWRWYVTIIVPQCPLPNFKLFEPYSGPCNVDVKLGNMVCSEPSMGETGNDLQMLQVEWDQTQPPGGYP